MEPDGRLTIQLLHDIHNSQSAMEYPYIVYKFDTMEWWKLEAKGVTVKFKEDDPESPSFVFYPMSIIVHLEWICNSQEYIDWVIKHEHPMNFPHTSITDWTRIL